MTPDLAQRVNGSTVKVIARHDITASKIVTFHELIVSPSLNFVQTIPEHSATRDTCSRSKFDRNIFSADGSIALQFSTEFDHGTAGILQIFKVKVKGQGHRIRSQDHSVT